MAIHSVRVVAARVASWVVSLGAMIAGVVLLLNRTVVRWEPVDTAEYQFEAVVVDVTGIGLALLCTGVLAFVAVLICEGFGWRQASAVGADVSRPAR